MHALRNLGICWQDLEVLDYAESTSIESLMTRAQVRWVGHSIRMDGLACCSTKMLCKKPCVIQPWEAEAAAFDLACW